MVLSSYANQDQKQVDLIQKSVILDDLYINNKFLIVKNDMEILSPEN